MKKFYLFLAILLIVLLILLGVFFGFRKEKSAVSSLRSEKAILELQPSNVRVFVGETFPVRVVLRAYQKVSGVDVVLKYDSEMLQPIDKKVDKTNSIFPVWPVNTIHQGVIRFSGLTRPGQTFLGEGTVATVWFKALKKGKGEVSFLFEKGSTTDSNVSSNGKDILQEVRNLNFVISFALSK